MHSVYLKSHSLTKDFFLLDFIFLIVTVTNRAEMDQILDTAKIVAKNTILKECCFKILVNCKFPLLVFDRVTLNYAQHAS